MEEVIIEKASDQNSITTIVDIGVNLFPATWNFSCNMKSATLIPYENANKISKLKFRLNDFDGVKDLNYLSFKVNLYTVGILGEPEEKILLNDLLVQNKKGNEWAIVNIEKHNIYIPVEGLYVVFIVSIGK